MATLGKPSITTPNALDLRALQTAVSNIRQRIEALEGALGAATSTVQSAAQISLSNILSRLAVLQNEIDAIDISGGDLTAMIMALPASTGASPVGDVPMVIAGTGVRVTGGDISRLIFQSSVNSGVSSSALVPVEIGGSVVLVTAGDIAALGGGTGGNIQTQIDALPYSSGAEPNGMIPFTIGGTAFRATAGDVARLLFHAPFNSGAESSARVAVQLSDGTVVLVTAGDIAHLSSASSLQYHFGTVAPVAPIEGDFWFNSTVGVKFTFVNDGTSTQWVEC